ncbi:MAG: hypothetical protein IPO21_08070 [Bacteroidales bacterium]|nr:hypothetical protein [Bacteroidales bacterium]
MRSLNLYIFFLVSFLLPFSIAAQNDFGVISLNSNKGLSNNIITSITQDNQGFMWIGTEHGLNKFNGYEITIYPHVPGVATSLTGNKINELMLDSRGGLWVTTNFNGVSLYDVNKDQFKNFHNSTDDISSLSLDMINSIAEDVNENVWVGTYFGLNSIDSSRKKANRYFTEFSLNISDEIVACMKKNNIPENIITFLRSHDKEKFSNMAEFRIKIINQIDQVEYLKHEKKLFCWGSLAFTEESQSDEKIMAIAPDSEGNVWLGLYENGLAYYNTSNKTYRYYTAQQNKGENSVNANDVNCLSLISGNLFIGGTSGWLDIYNVSKKKFKHFNTAPGNLIFKIKKWNKNDVILLTDLGLYLYSQEHDTVYDQKKSLEIIFAQENIQKSKNLFGDKVITAIFKDNHSNIWLGTKNGLFCIEKTKDFKNLTFDETDNTSIYRGDVSALACDSANIYIGYINSTLDIFDQNNTLKKRFNYFLNNPYNLGQGSIQTIANDSQLGILLGAFGGGAQMLKKDFSGFESIALDKNDVNHLGNHDVRSIDTDSEGKVWIALHGGGLSCYNPKTKELKRFKADYGNWRESLHENWLISVFCDAHDNVWVGSYSGLSVYNQNKNTFSSYKAGSSSSTITNNTINYFHQSLDGKIWIATNAGIDMYNPKDSTFSYIQILVKDFKLSVFSILEDKHQNLWLGTNKGIVKYSINSGEMKLFQHQRRTA